MEGVRQYVICVTAAAMLCGIVSGMVKNSAMKELVRMVCGVFLVMTVLRPLRGQDLTALPFELLPDARSGEEAAAEGEKAARQAMADIIKAETEAYILDKATGLGADLTVSVTLSGDEIPVPVSAVLRGTVSPYDRKRLENELQTELGITKENQQWTG